MNPEEIRALSIDEMEVRLDEAREELMNLRFQQSTGELVDFTRIRYTRRLIARFITIINERRWEDMMEDEL